MDDAVLYLIAECYRTIPILSDAATVSVSGFQFIIGGPVKNLIKSVNDLRQDRFAPFDTLAPIVLDKFEINRG